MTSYASAVDTAAHGEYRIRRDPADPRPLLRFSDRITADGSSGFAAEPGRYHLYGGWFCPWSHRITLTRALTGLTDALSVSYVDGQRDGRGWAFRERYGADPVNGFTLLREAFEASDPGFDGHVSVPTLWDRQRGRIVSNDYRTIGVDLATQFGTPAHDTYPERDRARIEELDAWLGPVVNHGSGAAGSDPVARDALLDAFAALDALLAGSRYLVGDEITEADVRLWVTLVRYDVGVNARREINAGGLAEYPTLWAYARDLYRVPAFRDTTDFAAFTAPGAVRPDWEAPARRDGAVPR